MKRTNMLSAMLIRIHERNNKRPRETDLLKSDEASLFATDSWLLEKIKSNSLTQFSMQGAFLELLLLTRFIFLINVPALIVKYWSTDVGFQWQITITRLQGGLWLIVELLKCINVF